MKTLATILMIFAFSNLFSQKGTFYLGGSAGLISSSSKTGSNPSNKSTEWALSPEIGTWISDNLQTGVAINFGGSSSEGSSSSYFGEPLCKKLLESWTKLSAICGFKCRNRC